MKKSYALIMIALCAAIGLTGCGKKVVAANEGLETERTSPVEITSVQKSSIENDYVYSGTIKAANEVTVAALVQGKVASVNYDVGSIVKAGDILFTMDTTDIESNISTLEASLESADANINSAKTGLDLVNGATMQTQIENAKIGVTNSELGVTNSELSLSNVELSLNKAKTDFENNKELYNLGIIAKDAYVQYEDGYNKAQIGYEQAKLAHEQAKVAHEQALKMYDITVNKMPGENMKRAQDSLALAQASKKSVVAQLESARNKLNDAKVVSPISGVISECNVKAGELISTAGPTPMKIMDNNNVNIEVGVSEQVINSVKIGDTTKLLINSVSKEFMQGTVISTSPAAKQDNTYNIKIEVENKDGLLKPGMFGEVYFTKEKSDDTIILLRSAILENEDGYYVFVEENGIAKKIDVTLGVEHEDKIEVTSGLVEDMNVVTLGQNYLEDGDKLIIASNGKEE